MYTVVLEREYYYKHRLFALCEDCYWTASILKEVETFRCPGCLRDQVSLIPLSKEETYEYSIDSKQGLQIKFSSLSKKSK
jgi:hypothetical protein